MAGEKQRHENNDSICECGCHIILSGQPTEHLGSTKKTRPQSYKSVKSFFNCAHFQYPLKNNLILLTVLLLLQPSASLCHRMIRSNLKSHPHLLLFVSCLSLGNISQEQNIMMHHLFIKEYLLQVVYS